MKKIISMFLMLATVVSLGACAMKNDETKTNDPSDSVSLDFAAQVSIAESKAEASAAQAEAELSEAIAENVKDIGKKEKNKRLVVKIPYHHGDEYKVFVMDKKGVEKHMLIYYFYDDPEIYYINRNGETVGDKKLVEKDDDLKMLVFKYPPAGEEKQSFDELYDLYTGDYAVKNNYIVIE